MLASESQPSRQSGSDGRRRVWLVNLYFGPGAAPTGALAESAALALQERGWDVEVLASRVGYNAIRGGTGARFRGRVHWLYTIFRDAQGLRGRLLCWSNFYLAVAWRIFTRPLPPKVILLTTPPFLAALFVVRRWFSRGAVELILWNQDTYPEVLAAVGLLSATSPLFRRLKFLECWSVRRLDRVVVLDQAMRQRLAAHGARAIAVVPNWESTRNLEVAACRDHLVEQVRAAKGAYRFVVLYTGNYGWGHDLRLVFDYLRHHPGQRLFYFVFAGSGVRWPQLKRLRADMHDEGVAVAEYVPRGVLQALLQEAHFGLVALEQPCVGLMSPSKIHSYLALAKPLIYLGGAGGNVAEAIADYDCGFTIPEHDAVSWERFVNRVAAADFPYEQYARNARRAFEERYQEDIAVRRFCSCVE